MIYLKTEVDGVEREIEIYYDEIFTRCFKCGKELPVDREMIIGMLKDGCSFADTSFSCLVHLVPND
ncbi:hypothetical protein [Paenibacillus rhizophilus]|uniref:Uncharacterized protein n=1 Tax=Paenibacillus rhizophilus TaxID=1850366 RepID=A0A3N9PYV7_9BACL|nr:hypothetical protein [Paenibacillus rhizophilus]RQW10386.1 hypothetical protein EH198_16345 [Paenibacillus rhizophilus]